MTQKITVTAVLSTDLKTAWDAYTAPEHIVQWNFASDDWHCPRATNDIRVGGTLNSRMEAKDGSMGFDFEAVYSDVIVHEVLGFDFSDGRHIETRFVAENGATRVTTCFDAETQNPLEMQQQGWQAILDNYKRHAETISPAT